MYIYRMFTYLATSFCLLTNRSHDIRIAPNYASTMDPHCDMDEFQIAEQFTKTLKKGYEISCSYIDMHMFCGRGL